MISSHGIRSLLLSTLGLIVGISIVLAFVYFSGEHPWHILQVIAKSAFGSRYDLGVTLYYTTPLIFTGLSVAIAFHAGLFNIGAEGQLSLAALATALFGVMLPNMPPIIGPVLALLFGVGIGAFWGWIAGYLKVRFGSHEVITTIMLNFIAAALVSWLVTSKFQNPDSPNPETSPIASVYFLRQMDPMAHWFGDAPVSSALFVGIFLAISLWFFLWRTPWGYEIRATGANEFAARIAGIAVARSKLLAMAMSGGLAGFVALSEVLGNAGRYRMGFSSDFGFVGIAVALLARSNPIGILFTALLFGALHKGAQDLDIETEFVTRDLSLVIQALIILCVSAAASWPMKKKKVQK